VVSLEAIFLSIAVLISENRALRLAERRANLDLQVNLLAEQESTATLQLVRQIADRLGVTSPADRKTADLAIETDVQQVLDQLERHLPNPRRSALHEAPAHARSRRSGFVPRWATPCAAPRQRTRQC